MGRSPAGAPPRLGSSSRSADPTDAAAARPYARPAGAFAVVEVPEIVEWKSGEHGGLLWFWSLRLLP